MIRGNSFNSCAELFKLKWLVAILLTLTGLASAQTDAFSVLDVELDRLNPVFV